MKTSELEQVISAYIDGEIPAGKLAAVERLVQHNERAAACYNEFMRIRQGFQALPPATLPPDFASGIVASIKQRQTSRSRPNSFPVRVLRIRRLVISGTISLCIIGLVAVLFMRSMSPVVTSPSDRVAARLPVAVPQESPVPVPAEQPMAVEPAKPEGAQNAPTPDVIKKEETWITAPVPLSVQKNNPTSKMTKPTLDALLWVRCTPIASQDKEFIDSFVKYCMSNSLNFTATGRQVYEFKMTRPDFANFVQWLRKNPLTGGDVQVSDALAGWVTGQNCYVVPSDQTGFQEEVQTIAMADELSIRLEIRGLR